VVIKDEELTSHIPVGGLLVSHSRPSGFAARKYKTDMWSLRMGRFLYEFRVGAGGALEGNGVRFDDDFDTTEFTTRLVGRKRQCTCNYYK